MRLNGVQPPTCGSVGTDGAIAAVGLALVRGSARVLAEIGGIAALEHAHQGATSTNPAVTNDTEGFYFAVGVTYAWPR